MNDHHHTLNHKDHQHNQQQQQQQQQKQELEQQQQQQQEQQHSVPRLPGPTKFDQTIRGYEVWTHKDDMTLLNHVLNRLQGGRWYELEAIFEGRHSARLCSHRWHFLRRLLLKGMAQPDSALQQWKKT
ncbi:hypothetical protein F4703DRAFT_1470945 [Phycomyces blakesleeanus]